MVPDDEASLRRLGRSLGLFSEPVAQLDKQWRYHRREVRRLHEKLFYRPLLGAVAKLAGPEARLSLRGGGGAAVRARLRRPRRPRCATSRR